MNLSQKREIAVRSLEAAIKRLLETPLDFHVGSYNGMYHGNKVSMDYSRLLKKRKAHVKKAHNYLKKIERLCYLSKKNKTKLDKLFEESKVYTYELRKKTIETINGLSRECGGFKVW